MSIEFLLTFAYTECHKMHVFQFQNVFCQRIYLLSNFVAMFMTGLTERETNFGKKNLKNQELKVLVQDSVQCKNIHYFPNLTSCFTRGSNTCLTG